MFGKDNLEKADSESRCCKPSRGHFVLIKTTVSGSANELKYDVKMFD